MSSAAQVTEALGLVLPDGASLGGEPVGGVPVGVAAAVPPPTARRRLMAEPALCLGLSVMDRQITERACDPHVTGLWLA
jgi:hypothetical protein